MEEQQRTEPRHVADIFLGLMIVRILEYFFIKENMIPTLSFVSFGVSIIFIYFFNRKHCWALSDFGVQGVINSKWYEVFLPALIWAGSAAAVIGLEFVLCRIFPNGEKFFDFVCFNQHIELTLSKADNTILVSWTLIGMIVCLIRAGFLEFIFRGLFFGVFRKKMNFYACNSLQAAMYVVWFLILPIRSIFFYDHKGRTILMILIFSLAQFTFAFLLGYVRLVCGTLWPGIAINFVYNFMTFNFVINGIGGEEAQNYVDNARWAVVNIVAMLMIVVYCKWLKKKFPPPAPDPEQKRIMEEQLEAEGED